MENSFITHSDKEQNEIIKNSINEVSTNGYKNDVEFLYEHIIKEKFAVSVGNFVFIPPIENIKVSSNCREEELKQTSKMVEDYVQVDIKIDNEDMRLFVHKSRVINENQSPSVTLYNIDKVNEKDLRVAFKNNFPNIFVKTVSSYLDYKKSLEYTQSKLLESEIDDK